MATTLGKLSALGISRLSAPGRYSDGGNLYLVISKRLTKSWSFIYRWREGSREAGLGSAVDVSLKTARALASEGRELLARKPPVDPLTVWRAPEPEETPTFEQAARDYLATKRWRTANSHRQGAALAARCTKIAKLKVNEIATADVLKVLAPIADTTPVATSRIRALIEGVLNAARARGHIPHDAPNPARWRGHLELLLPKRATPVQHFAALPYAELPGLVSKLRAWRQDAGGVFHIGAFGLEFLILTAARSNEVLGAQWSEIDLEAKTWTVPAARMKKAREHVVPLTDAALAILDSVPRVEGNPFIFPGARDGVGMCSKAFERVVRRLGYATTIHGFRSAFADWCGEETEADFEVREAALAHVIHDATVRAYRRGDALKKRRALMQVWSAFLDDRAADNVIPLRRA